MEKRVLKGIYFNLRDQKISSMLFSCFALSFQTLDNSHACIVFAALAEKQWMRLQHMAALAHMKLYSQWRRQETWDEIRTQIQVNSLKSYYIKHHKTTFKRISKLYRIYIYEIIYIWIYIIYIILYIYISSNSCPAKAGQFSLLCIAAPSCWDRVPRKTDGPICSPRNA